MPNFNDGEYPTEATVGNQRLRGFERQPQELLTQALSSVELHRRISKVAYELYLRRGRVHGHDLDDWLAAERIVLFQLGREKTQAEEEQFETHSRFARFEHTEEQMVLGSR